MRALLWRLLKPIVFLLNPEAAHNVIMAFLKAGILARNLPLYVVSGAGRPREDGSSAIRLWDLSFASPVGLAAGFDKDAEVVVGLPALGFGFVEIGTVTPRPQPGNPKPRLFRDPAREALFNRMGFNGKGAQAAAQRLARARDRLPSGFRVGVNIGKNKVTPLESAHEDYSAAAAPFEGLADYLVINVSSPNTPGLRSLQTEESLRAIVDAVNKVTSRWSRRPPLLLKLAPEVQGQGLVSLLENLERAGGIDGWVLTNTLGGQRPNDPQSGGWSGGPLTVLANESLRTARATSRLPIISVGGIMSCDEAEARMRAGASLVQLYSGWIFRGPSFPVEVARHLAMP